MDINELTKLLDSGLSIREIAKVVNKGYSTVRYWMKKYNLTPQYTIKYIELTN